MTADQFYGQLRERIGNPDPNKVPNAQLQHFVADGLDWLAEQLKYRVVTEKTAIALVNGVQETLIPEDLAWVIWVEWNTKRLTPAAQYAWTRDGTDWRNATAGVPREFAIQGRNLILLPPPDATSITTAPNLVIRYIAAATFGQGGPVALSELDQWLGIYKSAILWLKAHPSEESGAMLQEYQAEIAERLPLAKRRNANAIRDYRPHFHPQISRYGGAR